MLAFKCVPPCPTRDMLKLKNNPSDLCLPLKLRGRRDWQGEAGAVRRRVLGVERRAPYSFLKDESSRGVCSESCGSSVKGSSLVSHLHAPHAPVPAQLVFIEGL